MQDFHLEPAHCVEHVQDGCKLHKSAFQDYVVLGFSCCLLDANLAL